MAVTNISLETLRQRMSAGPLRLIDVRMPGEYQKLHAVGARSVPLNQLDPSKLAAPPDNFDEPIYFICQSGGRSARACEQLAAAGFQQTYSVQGGTAAWEAAGLPVERGTGATLSLERQVRLTVGILVVSGSLLAWLVHPAFLAIPLFVGTGLVIAGLTNFCGLGLLLAKMPWNSL